MSKTVAPLLSFSASGQIAKTQVYAEWKGRPYARRYVIPANPQSTAQMQTRDVFSWLSNVWKYLDGDVTAAWNAYAESARFTPRNGWAKVNIPPLRTATDLTGFIFSPAANSGLQALDMTLTAGAGQITVDLTPPPLPAGWTIVSAFAAAIADQNPHSGILYTVTSGSDASSPYSIVLTGLTAATLYKVGGWFSMTKTNGQTAYGQALMDTATPT